VNNTQFWLQIRQITNSRMHDRKIFLCWITFTTLLPLAFGFSSSSTHGQPPSRGVLCLEEVIAKDQKGPVSFTVQAERPSLRSENTKATTSTDIFAYVSDHVVGQYDVRKFRYLSDFHKYLMAFPCSSINTGNDQTSFGTDFMAMLHYFYVMKCKKHTTVPIEFVFLFLRYDSKTATGAKARTEKSARCGGTDDAEFQKFLVKFMPYIDRYRCKANMLIPVSELNFPTIDFSPNFYWLLLNYMYLSKCVTTTSLKSEAPLTVDVIYFDFLLKQAK
jgi:hypothetical protein